MKIHDGWSPLKNGDIVDIVAPGWACQPEVLNSAVEILSSWGLRARVPKKIFAKDVICSNTDTARFQFLEEALTATDSRAVWCVRGGYGSIRLIPELVKLKVPKHRAKLFIGLSDISTLHLYLNQVWKWPTIHGPLMDRFGKGEVQPKYVREMKALVFGEIGELTFSNLKPMNPAAKTDRDRVLKGEVSGGNLITLQSAIGTKCPWQTKGKILFFEEIGERGYRVDRALEHFRQVGAFDQAKAIIFGDFTGGLEPDGSSKVQTVLKRFAMEMKIPVLSGIQSGHGPIQRPVPFATQAKLTLGRKPQLVCQTGVRQAGK